MRYWFPLALTLAFMVACDENSIDPEDIRPAFREGMQWVYVWEVHQFDSAGTEFYQDRDSIRLRVAGVDQRLGDVTGLVRVEASSLLHPNIAPGRVWYSQGTDGLREVAYQISGGLPVVYMRVTGPEKRYRFPSLSQPAILLPASDAVDSVLWRDEPRLVLRYPLEQGLRWTAFSVPFLQTRMVTAFGDEELPGGRKVRAASIATINSYFGPNDRWIDKVCTQGLISRTIALTVTMTDASLIPIGMMVHTEMMTLVSYSE